MSLLVEELCVIYQSKDVYEDAIIWLLVEVTFFSSMTFVDYDVYSLEKILHKIMFADSITWLSVFHEGDKTEIQEAFDIPVNNPIFRSLSFSISDI